MAALYPGAVALGALVLSEAPFSALMIAQLCLWTAAWQARPMGKAVGLSILTGLTAGAGHAGPAKLAAVHAFGPGGGDDLQRRGQSRRRPAARDACSGDAGRTGPGDGSRRVRNARVTGHFVPTTLQVGASLYDGLHSTATGASNMDFVAAMTEAERRHPAADGGRPGDSFEYRLDRRMAHEALRWARANPGRVAELAAVKLGRLWNLWPNERQFSAWPIRLVVALGYLPILVLGLAGVVDSLRRGGPGARRMRGRAPVPQIVSAGTEPSGQGSEFSLAAAGQAWPYVLCWLPAAYFTLLHVVFVSSIRYREPAMLALIVLAAGTVAQGIIRNLRSEI